MMGSVMGRSTRALPGQLGLLPGVEETAAHYHETPYWVVERLLRWADGNWPFDACHWAEPCAGDGAIVQHVRRFIRESDTRMTAEEWDAIEMRDTTEALRKLGAGVTVQSPCRVEDANGRQRIGCGITNLPWYETTISVVEGFWRAFPRYPLAALLCSQFFKDGDRPKWFADHAPAYVLRVGGRVAFGRDAAYPHAVDWVIWQAGGEPADRTLFEVLV